MATLACKAMLAKYLQTAHEMFANCLPSAPHKTFPAAHKELTYNKLHETLTKNEALLINVSSSWINVLKAWYHTKPQLQYNNMNFANLLQMLH